MLGPFWHDYAGTTMAFSKALYKTSPNQVRVPLPYEARIAYKVRVHPAIASIYTPAFARDGFGPDSNVQNRVANMCYGKFVDKMKRNASLGQNMAEAGQTMKLVSDALGLLRRPLSKVDKYMKNKGSIPAGLGSGWLAYHFGVDPLIKDLHELGKIIDSQLASRQRVSVSSRLSRTEVSFTNGVRVKRTADVIYRCRMAGVVRVTDPFFLTMNELGVLNPAALAWELVPFSFVVDWFFKFNGWLNQFTDFAGLDVENPYTTQSYSGSVTVVDEGAFASTSNGSYGFQNVFQFIRLRRSTGMVTPVLQASPATWSTSAVRAATSISLLLQQLPKR